jgi:hypothetical protein
MVQSTIAAKHFVKGQSLVQASEVSHAEAF